MTLRQQKPVFWPPVGLSDALDGTDDFKGACSLLSNLIPAPNNGGMMIARPAAVQIPTATLPDYGGGDATALLTVGDIAYGMYASAMYSGKDRPFAYNMVTGAFSPIAGLSSGTLPATQPAAGDWTPPTVAAVGSRVLFTHPGFPGGASQPIAFLEFQGDTHGTTTIDNILPALTILNAAGQIPVIGQQIFGSDIAPNTTIASIAPGGTSITLSQVATGSHTGTQLYTTSQNSPNKFGWLDVSNAAISITSDTINGVPALVGGFSVAGIQPGMAVAGAGIPAGTVVEQAQPLALGGSNNLVGISVTMSMTAATIVVVNNQIIGNGMLIGGVGIPAGCSISAVTLTSNDFVHTVYTATLSLAAIQTLSDAPCALSGAEITLSKAPTATAGGVGLTVSGGSESAPIWSAGDTQINPLAAVPIFVRQFSDRAYFGINTTNPSLGGVTASDSGLPCQVSQANQIITFSDGVPVTAAAGLGLANQLGGIIQSLMVFQGASNIRQITGDFALGTWAENSLQTATGTLAPNSIASTPKGLLFAAPDGLRLIDFNANISEPIGTRGTGLVIPFINAVTPSRAAAAYNENVYRITLTWQPPRLLQLIYGAAQRTDEFWFHLDIQKFSGPHTSTMDLVAPWQAANSFICAPSFGRGALWRSDTLQSAASIYLENVSPLFWTLRTVLLPDDPSMFANSLTESSVFASMSAATQWLAGMIDDQGQTLDQAYVWLGPNVTQSQLPIYWRNPIVFRQAAFQLAGNSEPQTLIGTIQLRYQKLKYQITFRPVSEFVLDQSPLGGPDVLGP